MNRIRPLEDKHAAAMARLMLLAYPGYNLAPDARQSTEGWVREVVKRGERDRLEGYFEPDGTLSGGVRILSQPMNLRMHQVKAIGLGALCVDLLHKKKKIALELLCNAFKAGRESGACMAVLDPFHIGFYKKMGCGIAMKHHQFRLTPYQMPSNGDRSRVVELTKSDFPEIISYHNEYAALHHGMLMRAEHEVREVLEECQMILGVREKSQLMGIMAIRFQRTAPENLFKTNLLVEELVYDHPGVLQAFTAFLHAQADQVNQIILTSQDSCFEVLLDNPDTGSDDTFHTRKNEMYRTGNGMMVRILDLSKVMNTIQAPETMKEFFPIQMRLEDSLMTDLSGNWLLGAENGRITVKRQAEQQEVDLALTVSDLASLVMGSVDFNSLIRYGRVTVIKPEIIKCLAEIFHYPEAPVCLSRF